MPTLPISTNGAGPTDTGLFNSLAIMLFPDDEVGRRAFSASMVCAFAADYAERHDAALEMSPELVRILVDASGDSALSAEVSRRFEKARAAAAQVRIVHALAHHAPDDASRRKAVFLMGEVAMKQSRKGGNKSQLDKVWSTFHSVAHLWAAFDINGYRFHSDDKVGYTTDIDFQALLIRSEIFHEWGQNHYSPPRRAKERPFLDSAETWRVPSDWNPPKWRDSWPNTTRVEPLRLSSWMLSQLDRYSDEINRQKTR